MTINFVTNFNYILLDSCVKLTTQAQFLPDITKFRNLAIIDWNILSPAEVKYSHHCVLVRDPQLLPTPHGQTQVILLVLVRQQCVQVIVVSP